MFKTLTLAEAARELAMENIIVFTSCRIIFPVHLTPEPLSCSGLRKGSFSPQRTERGPSAESQMYYSWQINRWMHFPRVAQICKGVLKRDKSTAMIGCWMTTVIGCYGRSGAVCLSLWTLSPEHPVSLLCPVASWGLVSSRVVTEGVTSMDLLINVIIIV